MARNAGTPNLRAKGAHQEKNGVIITIVVCGVIGAWIYYWIGDRAGAIQLSIAASVRFAALAAVALFLVPHEECAVCRGRGRRHPRSS